MQIDLSGLDRFVPKPKGDDAGVDPSLEELNGGGVAQDVGGYVFVDESRALLASGGGVLFDEPFDGVAAQDAAATAGEQRLSWSCTLLLNPVSENRGEEIHCGNVVLVVPHERYPALHLVGFGRLAGR